MSLLFLLSLNIVNFNDNNFTTQSLDDRNLRLLKYIDALVTRYPCVEHFCMRIPRNVICLNDQTNIASFMCFKRCVAFNLYIISPKIYLLPVFHIQKIEKLDDTHLLKHIKQAILVWSFRQNLFLGCYPVFPAISAPIEFIVLGQG